MSWQKNSVLINEHALNRDTLLFNPCTLPNPPPFFPSSQSPTLSTPATQASINGSGFAASKSNDDVINLFDASLWRSFIGKNGPNEQESETIDFQEEKHYIFQCQFRFY